METSHLPINTCIILVRLAQPKITYVNCTYVKSNAQDRSMAGVNGTSQGLLAHAITFCRLPDNFFSINFSCKELLVIRKFPTQICHKVRQDIHDTISKIGDLQILSLAISHDNGYKQKWFIEISREPTLIFLIQEATPASQIKQFYDDLNDRFPELSLNLEPTEVHTSDKLTIIPVEVSMMCSNFHNKMFQKVEPFYAMSIDVLKPATTNLQLLQCVTKQIPIEQIKWILPTSFLIPTQLEFLIGTIQRTATFNKSSVTPLVLNGKEPRIMGYDYLIKNFALCGRQAVAFHAEESKLFIAAKPYHIMDKTPESNAAETTSAALTNSVVDLHAKVDVITHQLSNNTSSGAELQAKLDVIMHRLSNISYQMEQLQLTNSDKNVPSPNSNSPARKVPTFLRMNTVLTKPSDDQDMTE